jgi:tetrahydromethanopterin S-methyltransferase subunit G
MELTERHLDQIGLYVKAHLYEWIPVSVLEMSERMVRGEEELKAQRELMLQGFQLTERRFEQIEKRFEQIDKRFEQVDKRFEQVDKRFEQVDKRFEDVNQRMSGMMWLIGIGFALLGTLMSLYTFLA